MRTCPADFFQLQHLRTNVTQHACIISPNCSCSKKLSTTGKIVTVYNLFYKTSLHMSRNTNWSHACDREEWSEAFHSCGVVVVAPVFTLFFVFLSLWCEQFLLSLNALRQAGMIYIVLSTANGCLYTGADYSASRAFVNFDYHLISSSTWL